MNLSEAEISELVEFTIDELARREGVPKPKWKKGKSMEHRRGVIVFDMPIINKFWGIDKEKARVYIRYSLAHEFHHYLEWVKGEALPYFAGEAIRDDYAFRFCGLTAEGLRSISDYLWDVLEEIEAARARPKAVLVKAVGLGVLESWLKKQPSGSVLTFKAILKETGLPKGSCWAMLERMVEVGRLKRKGEDYVVG